jgi:hypothetical protein
MSQVRNKYRANHPYGLLSILPDEIILRILSFTRDEDFKNIATIAKKFNRIMHEEVYDSFFGRSLKFIRWEQKQIQQFAQEVKRFVKDSQVTIFNRPHENTRQRLHHYATCFGSIFSLSITSLVLAYIVSTFPEAQLIEENRKRMQGFIHTIHSIRRQPYDASVFYTNEIETFFYKMQVNGLAEENARIEMTFHFCQFMFTVIILSLPLLVLTYLYDAGQENLAYLAQALTETDRETAQTCLQAHQLLIKNNNVIPESVHTKADLIKYLNDLVKEVKIHAHDLDTYLLRQNRFRRKKFGNEDIENLNKTDPKLASYGKNMLTFWQQADKHVRSKENDFDYAKGPLRKQH